MLGRAPQILPEQVQDVPVADVERQSVHQKQMIDGGIERLHIGPQHEAVGGEMIVHLPHRRFGRDRPAIPTYRVSKAAVTLRPERNARA